MQFKAREQKDLSAFSCDVLDNYLNKISLLLMIRDPSHEKTLALYANRCLSKVQVWLKKFQGHEAKRQEQSQKILNKVNLLSRIREHNKKNKNESISKFYKDYNSIESSHSFINIFGRLALAEHSANQGWLREEVEKLIRFDVEELYFDFPSTLDRNMALSLEELYFHFFQVWRNNKNELLKQFIFLFSLSQSNEERYQNLRMNLDLAWSLADIRGFVKSVNYGQRYPGFWYRVLNRRSSELEVDFFLNSLHSVQKIKSLAKGELWILLEKIPYQAPLKATLVSRLWEIWNNGGAYDKFLVLKFLEDQQIKKEFELKDNSFKRALFQIKKETYTEIYSQSSAELLMIFELVKLGDYQESFLEHLLWI